MYSAKKDAKLYGKKRFDKQKILATTVEDAYCDHFWPDQTW